ncbi:MAG: hypothetical protein H0U19_15220, partial [Acidobacteria bacterium]|nr:hypothetical protein [Acidobacteriota bacterium]
MYHRSARIVRLFPVAVFAVFFGVGTASSQTSPPPAQSPAASAPVDTEQLRQELERLRQEFETIRETYGQRLTALEARLTAAGAVPGPPAAAPLPTIPVAAVDAQVPP